MNKKALRSKMASKGDTYKTLAEKIGISYQWLSNKINGSRGADFTRKEMMAIKKEYNLLPEEVDVIFFSEKVS